MIEINGRSPPGKLVQEIYCDESGFSGNNLLEDNSPLFSYASVAISNEEAKEIIEKVKKDYRIQGNDLKGKNLVKNELSRKAISYILKELETCSKFVFFDKKYLLAVKLFEYILEPVIAEKNYIFYNLGFHRFVSNYLYEEFMEKVENAEEIFGEFSTLMRELDNSGLQLEHIFNSSALSQNERTMFDSVKIFSYFHRDPIKEELDSLKGTGVGKWILDASITALSSLLFDWGQKFEQMNVFCDISKPLKENQELFNKYIGREDKAYFEFNGVLRPITYNLSKPINFVNSKDYPGIQLADIIAYTFQYALVNKTKETDAWKEPLFNMYSETSIFPDREEINPHLFNVKRNHLLFMEIMRRTIEKQDLLENLQETVLNITQYLRFQSNFFSDDEEIPF